MSKLEDTLLYQIRSAGLPDPERGWRFQPPRRWRLDLAWPDVRLAVEIQGGTWANGRHVRGEGYENDREKANNAQLAGWLVLEVTAAMVEDGRALEYIERGLATTRPARGVRKTGTKGEQR